MDAYSRILAIGSGAFVGANARYWLGGWVQERTGTVFPWGTLLVNISGSLLIGLAMGLALEQNWALGWRLFLVVGVLGGYTTFSAFAYETVQLLSEGNLASAFGHMAGSLVSTVLAAWLGLALARALVGG
ncbi:MAG: fluoride efflux transporter CrcB [Armatimonadetes bacterium]|nr:fluoride efflux transporter CrcB [Armatimonadota bacterium]